MIEFVALANHRKTIRAEIAAYAERWRTTQLDALATALTAAGIDTARIPPSAALLLMSGLAQVLAIEQALGLSAGHDATLAWVERAISQLDAPAPSSKS